MNDSASHEQAATIYPPAQEPQSHWLPAFLNDVQIVEGSVPQTLPAPTASGVLWQAQPGRFLLRVPDVAAYEVRDGVQITIQRAPAASEPAVAAFLRATPLAALLFQRGVLALHAAVVATSGSALVIAGASASGKSTLAAALTLRGYVLLADDLTAIELVDGVPMVYPLWPEVTLWPDAVRQLGLKHQTLTSAETGSGALCYHAPATPAARPSPLRALVSLSAQNSDALEHERIDGARRFEMIGQLAYNTRIADALFDRQRLFLLGVSIARNASLETLRRPRGRWCMDALLDHLEGLLA